MCLSKVLIVEDEPDIQMIAQIALVDISGFEVKIANHGMEALEILKYWTPDLILMDVMMPILDGPQTVTKLSQDECFKMIPVIFMTAKSTIEEIEDLKKMAVLEVLIKPFDPISLGNVLKDILTKKGEFSS